VTLRRIEEGQIEQRRAEPERGAPAPDRLISGAPVFETWPTYESADGQSHVGIWRSTPGAWRIRYTEWEYCEMLEGVSIVTAADGQSWTLKPGDRFVIEPGFEGSWEVVETTTKRYVIRL
jgi:uncharacterized cupin superfamily protein